MRLQFAERTRDANGDVRIDNRVPTATELADLAIRLTEANRNLHSDRAIFMDAIRKALQIIGASRDGDLTDEEALDEIEHDLSTVMLGMRTR